MTAKLIIVFLSMTLANCIVQSFKPEPDFWVAAELSFNEGWALLTYWFFENYIWKGKDL